MILYPYIPKTKKRKPNSKQRELQSSWNELLAKYPSKPAQSTKSNYHLEIPRKTPHYPSLDTNCGSCAKIPDKEYTGSAILGIATLHKSNGIPVFSKQEAIDISKMRRG